MTLVYFNIFCLRYELKTLAYLFKKCEVKCLGFPTSVINKRPLHLELNSVPWPAQVLLIKTEQHNV